MAGKIRNLILVLRKLGVLRYGVKSYRYTSGKDMPARALLDDVYDDEKDLIHKEDFTKIGNILKRKTGQSTVRYCSRCGKELPLNTPVCTACKEPVKS